MSGAQAPSLGNGAGPGKKAVHVKWAGKTIALGTFPSAEADEKCARAKALTRAWRSTMRPKPSRDWVMVELERLGVRVVSGRLGRKAGEEDETMEPKPSVASQGGGVGGSGGGGGTGVSGGHHAPGVNNMATWSSNTELDNLMQQRRSSSLGLSMMNERDLNRRGSLNSLGPHLGLDSNDPSMPPHRPLVGGGSAAAYEAARADHYAQKRDEQQRRTSGLGLSMGGGMSGAGSMQMGLSVNPNQMLKLHHMNLLNEIQETTLMMNLYQQQQLQQQQQQLQQQHATAIHDLSTGSDRRSSIGLAPESASAPRAAPKASAPATSAPAASASAPAARAPASAKPPNASSKQQDTSPAPKRKPPASLSNPEALQEELMKGQKEQEELEKRLKKLRDDIARREREAEELQKQADVAEAAAETTKTRDGATRPTDDKIEQVEGSMKEESQEERFEPDAKKAKTEEQHEEEKPAPSSAAKEVKKEDFEETSDNREEHKEETSKSTKT